MIIESYNVSATVKIYKIYYYHSIIKLLDSRATDNSVLKIIKNTTLTLIVIQEPFTTKKINVPNLKILYTTVSAAAVAAAVAAVAALALAFSHLSQAIALSIIEVTIISPQFLVKVQE